MPEKQTRKTEVDRSEADSIIHTCRPATAAHARDKGSCGETKNAYTLISVYVVCANIYHHYNLLKTNSWMLLMV